MLMLARPHAAVTSTNGAWGHLFPELRDAGMAEAPERGRGCAAAAAQHSFKIHNGKHLIKDTDKTTLAFSSAEEAQRWHETFKAVIKELAAQAVEVRAASCCLHWLRVLLWLPCRTLAP